MNRLPTIKADFLEAGSGPVVMLIHSSVSGARMWGPLTPSARSANLIAGDGTRDGLSAPNKEPATNQKTT
jgi:hypothetical protein